MSEKVEQAVKPEDNIITIGGSQYRESDLTPESITSIRHILILQNKNKELSTDFAINQTTIAVLEGSIRESLKDVPVVPVVPEKTAKKPAKKAPKKTKA